MSHGRSAARPGSESELRLGIRQPAAEKTISRNRDARSNPAAAVDRTGRDCGGSGPAAAGPWDSPLGGVT